MEPYRYLYHNHYSSRPRVRDFPHTGEAASGVVRYGISLRKPLEYHGKQGDTFTILFLLKKYHHKAPHRNEQQMICRTHTVPSCPLYSPNNAKVL